MKKFNKEGLKSEKGFTMIELIIVIAIMGILAAILVPSFMQMTRKSRLKSDISTVRQLQTQIDLFVADHDGKYPAEPAASGDGIAKTTDLATFGTEAGIKSGIKGLIEEEYIKEKELDDGDELDLQSEGVDLVWDTINEEVGLKVPDDAANKVLKLAKTLSKKELDWITNLEYVEDGPATVK